MQVAVVSVRVVQHLPDGEVLVVAVGHALGGRRVPARALDRGAAARPFPVDRETALHVAVTRRRLEAPVVEIIRVIAVPNHPMPAPRAVPALALVALLVAQGCRLSGEDAGPGREEGQARRVAVATIAPLADLVTRVAGPEWEVRVVIPPGTSPHVFEPTPRDVRQIAGARLAVVVGAGYDGWVARLLAACASEAVIHDAGAAIGLRLPEGEHEEHDHLHGHAHGEGALDPHWWLSAELAAQSLGPLAERLAALDPAGAAGYRERAAASAAELRRLDAELLSILAPARGKTFVTAHRAWDTFAARYGLVPAGAVEPVPGREPSPRELRDLVVTVRHAGLERLFTEPQFPETAARIIAEEAGVALAVVDPIGGVAGRLRYDDLMRWNAAAFVAALGGTGGRG